MSTFTPHLGRHLEATVTVLDADTFATLRTLEGTSPGISDVSFNPAANRELAVAYDDRRILIWDARAGVPQYSLPGHDGPTADLDWTADGSRLVSVGFDGTVRVFTMDPNELIDLARSLVTRVLTEQECRQYLESADC